MFQWIYLQAGRPIRNGTYASKKMVASVYAKAEPELNLIQFDIFVNNAIEDQSYVSYNTLIKLTNGKTE